MTNATKTLAVLFVVFTGISLIMYLGSGQEASRAFQSKIVSVDTSQVNRIVINTPSKKQPIHLFEKKGSWKVKQGDGPAYPAENQSIQRSLRELTGMQVNALVTRDTADFTRYKVDSTGTEITLRHNEQVLDRVIVGAPQVVSRRQFNSYVRPADRQEVYSVEGYLKPRFDKSVNDWRDKTVWNVPRDQISRIDFVFPADSAYSIKQAGKNQWVSNGDSLNSSKIQSILNQLGQLEANSFVKDASKQQFGKEKFAVQLQLKSGEQRKLRFKNHPADTTQYQVVASDYPYVFTLSKSTWQDRVFKSRSELLGKN